jgi:hypothetical protein
VHLYDILPLPVALNEERERRERRDGTGKDKWLPEYLTGEYQMCGGYNI